MGRLLRVSQPARVSLTYPNVVQRSCAQRPDCAAGGEERCATAIGQHGWPGLDGCLWFATHCSAIKPCPGLDRLATGRSRPRRGHRLVVVRASGRQTYRSRYRVHRTTGCQPCADIPAGPELGLARSTLRPRRVPPASWRRRIFSSGAASQQWRRRQTVARSYAVRKRLRPAITGTPSGHAERVIPRPTAATTPAVPAAVAADAAAAATTVTERYGPTRPACGFRTALLSGQSSSLFSFGPALSRILPAMAVSVQPSTSFGPLVCIRLLRTSRAERGP